MLRWTVILAVLALAATPVLAQTPPEQPEQQRPEPSKSEMTFMGEVVSVDATAKTLTVRESSASSPSTPSTPPAQPAGKTMTFNFDSSTKIISKADKPVSPETPPAAGQPSGKNLEAKDLKAGDRVTVKYTSEDGKHVAKSIEVGKKATT